MSTANLLLYGVYILGAFAGIAISAWIFDLVLRLSNTNKQLKIQTQLLMKMGEKAGVSRDEIDGIANAS